MVWIYPDKTGCGLGVVDLVQTCYDSTCSSVSTLRVVLRNKLDDCKDLNFCGFIPSYEWQNSIIHKVKNVNKCMTIWESCLPDKFRSLQRAELCEVMQLMTNGKMTLYYFKTTMGCSS